jgi:hypothetical protein
MRMVRCERRALLALVAVLLLAAAWTAVGDRTPASLQHRAEVVHVERNGNGTVAPVELADAAFAPIVGAVRSAEPRQAPLWVMPGLAAALAARCMFRRLRLRPTLLARQTLLRGSLANRAPPLASFA